jgi:PhnB protein
MTSSAAMPYLHVSDSKAAVRFYEKAFGAETISGKSSGDGDAVFCSSQLAICGGVVMVGTEKTDEMLEAGTLGGTSAAIRLQYPSRQDFKSALFQCMAAGARTIMHAQRTRKSEIQAIVRDPEGHVWTLSAPS